jgi:catalase-peroxidase
MMHSQEHGLNWRTEIWDQKYDLGPEVPSEEPIWQDPVPAVTHQLLTNTILLHLKVSILASRIVCIRISFTA